MAIVAATVASVVGIGASLLMLVLLVASAPNSTDAQAHRLKIIAISVCLVTLLSVIGAIWAAIAGRAWLGAGIGLFPAAYCVVLFIVMLVVEQA